MSAVKLPEGCVFFPGQYDCCLREYVLNLEGNCHAGTGGEKFPGQYCKCRSEQDFSIGESNTCIGGTDFEISGGDCCRGREGKEESQLANLIVC